MVQEALHSLYVFHLQDAQTQRPETHSTRVKHLLLPPPATALKTCRVTHVPAGGAAGGERGASLGRSEGAGLPSKLSASLCLEARFSASRTESLFQVLLGS